MLNLNCTIFTPSDNGPISDSLIAKVKFESDVDRLACAHIEHLVVLGVTSRHPLSVARSGGFIYNKEDAMVLRVAGVWLTARIPKVTREVDFLCYAGSKFDHVLGALGATSTIVSWSICGSVIKLKEGCMVHVRGVEVDHTIAELSSKVRDRHPGDTIVGSCKAGLLFQSVGPQVAIIAVITSFTAVYAPRVSEFD